MDMIVANLIVSIMNDQIESLIVGTIAYFLVGRLMAFLNINFDIWLGRKGGKKAWLITVLTLSAIYHSVKTVLTSP